MLDSYIESVIDRHGLLSWLDLSLEAVGSDSVTLGLPYDEKFANTNGAVHGGVIASLMDFASAMALKTQVDDPDGTATPTTNLTVGYTRPATFDVVATASVVTAGSSMGFTAVEVANADDGDEVVAYGTTTFRLFDR